MPRPKSDKTPEEIAEIANRLNQARKMKGLTYKDVAEALDLSKSAVGNLFTGNHALSDRALVRVCNFLEVPPKRIDPSYVQPKMIIGSVLTVPD